VLRLRVPLDPLLRDGEDLVGALEPALAGVVDLIESAYQCHAECRSPNGLIVAVFKPNWRSDHIQLVMPSVERELPPRPFDERIGCGPAVVDHAAVDAESSRPECGAARQGRAS
jgi:hypothetical protein